MGRRIRERVISCQTWLLNFYQISWNATRFKEKGKLTELQENFISDGVHLKCTGATHVVDKEAIIGKMGQRRVPGRPCRE